MYEIQKQKQILDFFYFFIFYFYFLIQKREQKKYKSVVKCSLFETKKKKRIPFVGDQREKHL